MNTLENEVKEAIQKLSDVDLARLVEFDFREHTEEAIAFARAEIARRGLLKEKAAAPGASGPAATPQTAAAGPAGPADPEVPGRVFSEFAPREPSKGAPVMGAVWLALAALITNIAVLVFATAFVGVRSGGSLSSDLPLSLLFYMALIAGSIWAGKRRRPRWASFLAVSLAGLAALTFVARISLSSMELLNSVMAKATLITAVIMAVLAGVFYVIGAVKRRAAN